MAGVALELYPEFGYVIFTVILSFVLLAYLSIKVGTARKKYGVKYPTLYDDKQPMYNCVQRAHQNTLEGFPFFLVFLIFGALRYPLSSSACGVIWIVSRLSYAHGYYTGDPEKRLRGSYGYLALFAMMGMSIAFACQLLGWI